MSRRSTLPGVALFCAMLLPVLVAAAFFFSPSEVEVARGKSAAVPLSDTLTADQSLAQELALADSRVQSYTVGQRTEVFGVANFLDINTPVNALGCNTDNCRIVNIFNFDESATVQAFVRLDTREVVEVYYQPGIRPGINRRLADRAMEIALNEPTVIEVIGEQRAGSDWAPMDSSLVGTVCEEGHMCVAPTFDMGDYIFWAVVDLTDETFVDTFWTGTDGSASAAYPYPEAYTDGLGAAAGGCPASGSVNRGGWQLDYNTTGTDGFRVSNARYNGQLVITSAKLAEWHADYGGGGYQDSTGCGGGGGGFPIYPFGDTRTEDISENGVVVGFDVIQDFRMGSWGNNCNYRYEQHFQFYNDGRFRTVQAAYGKGCGQDSWYRGLMRIDLAVGGTDANDVMSTWNGTAWQPVTSETRWCPEGATNAACTSTATPDANGYRWLIEDSQTNSGFYIMPSRDQFGDPNSNPDDEFVYVLQHNASEGDNDLGVFNAGCCNDFDHGPETYMNPAQALNNTSNLVLWYVPQALTDASAPDYSCWTVQGGSNPITYPCFTGPMFVPTSVNTNFTMPTFPSGAALVNQNVAFTNTSVGNPTENLGSPNVGMEYTWNFGDGSAVYEGFNATHTYATDGAFTVSLTATNGYETEVATQTINVAYTVDAGFTIPAGTLYASDPISFTNTTMEGLETAPAGLSYSWDFGVAGATSTDISPTYTYTEAGSYNATLTAGNGFYSDTHSVTVNIVEVPTAVTLGDLNATPTTPILFGAVALGLLAAAGVVIYRRR